jgi:hypothetical protein
MKETVLGSFNGATTLSIIILAIMTVGIMTSSMINAGVVYPVSCLASVVSFILLCYAECRYA